MPTSIDTTTDLYRYFDADDRLLYVGISFSAVARASQHRAEKGWWQHVARMTVEHLPSRSAAEQAEREAIRTERPLHNVTHNNSASGVTTTKAVKESTFAGRVFAFGMPDGSCPVGYVTKMWEPDGAHSRPTLEVDLYSWVSGYFGFRTMFIDVQGGMQFLEADFHMENGCKVFDMDPLSEFQTQWKNQHGDAA